MGQVSSEARNLQLTCSLNLMSCYLKTKQFSEAVAEGTMVCLLSDLSTSSCYYMWCLFKMDSQSHEERPSVLTTELQI